MELPIRSNLKDLRADRKTLIQTQLDLASAFLDLALAAQKAEDALEYVYKALNSLRTVQKIMARNHLQDADILVRRKQLIVQMRLTTSRG